MLIKPASRRRPNTRRGASREPSRWVGGWATKVHDRGPFESGLNSPSGAPGFTVDVSSENNPVHGHPPDVVPDLIRNPGRGPRKYRCHLTHRTSSRPNLDSGRTGVTGMAAPTTRARTLRVP